MTLANWLAPLRSAISGLGESVVAYFPRIAAAIVILLLGWLLARGLRYVVERLLRRFDKLIPAGLLGAERQEWGRKFVRLLGGLTFWLVLLVVLGAAAEALGLSALTGGLSGFAGYVPRLISAVLVLCVGLISGNLAAGWILTAAGSARIAYGPSAAKAARALIFLVASVVALAQAGIDSTLLVIAVSIILAAFLGGAALAFGLGARATVSNILGAHYLQRAYKVNQRVRIGEHEGRLVEIQPTGILLDTSEGVTLIPGARFSEQSSMLIDEDPTS